LIHGRIQIAWRVQEVRVSARVYRARIDRWCGNVIRSRLHRARTPLRSPNFSVIPDRSLCGQTGVSRRRPEGACTVESLALPVHPVCDAAASSRIKETARRVVPRRGFHPLSWAEGPCLDFGHSCGRQSCLRAAFQAAVSDTRRISQASLRDACEHEAGENNCELREWSVGRRPERPPAGTIACHTRRSPACHNGQSRVMGRRPMRTGKRAWANCARSSSPC
jgi:hypothetical protein